jgi:hypothetical protein
MGESVSSKITKVLSECLILRCGNDGLDVISIAVLVNIFLHQISALWV